MLIEQNQESFKLPEDFGLLGEKMPFIKHGQVDLHLIRVRSDEMAIIRRLSSEDRIPGRPHYFSIAERTVELYPPADKYYEVFFLYEDKKSRKKFV